MGKNRLHPVYHTSFLKPYYSREKTTIDTPVPVVLGDDSEGFLVEAIIGKRTLKGVVQYQVKWLGTSEVTWEKLDNLFQVSGLIDEYESTQQKKKTKKKNL